MESCEVALSAPRTILSFEAMSCWKLAIPESGRIQSAEFTAPLLPI